MQELIELAIRRKAKGVLRKHKIDIAAREKHSEKYLKRTGLTPGLTSHADPTWWSYHPHFNPRYCITHAKFLATVIWRKLQVGLYRPTPAIQFDIPKPDGTSRQIMAFSIPDAALANVVHRSATKRNINLFSAYSFAYRPDKNVFDAIIHLERSLDWPKSYIVQYDFSKYFDTINHSYLKKLIFDRKMFLLPEAERNAIEAFLSHEYCHVTTYQNGVFDVREAGVPQGSSLSLFLSNAASHELDLALERRNGTFVRFADDVVAVTKTYTDALAVAEEFRTHCHQAGLTVNFEKSPGILLFEGGPERDRRDFSIDTDDGSILSHTSKVDYLGHQVTAKTVRLPLKTVKRIKRRIAEIIYKHLFLYRRGDTGAFSADRVGAGFYDWDLVTCLNEVRKYMYGGLRESHIRAFLEDDEKPPFLRGLMAFFPLTKDIEQLRELDGWLLSVVRRAIRERVRVINSFGHPHTDLSKAQVLAGDWYFHPEIFNDTSLPSFVRAWRVSRKFYLRYGLADIRPPSYYSLLSY